MASGRTIQADELRATDVGIVERTWFEVRTGSDYGYGVQFPDTPDGHRDAVACAKGKIKRFDYGTTESFSRVWVHRRIKIRWLPAAGRIESGVTQDIDSVEITLREAEKDELRKVGA